MKTPGLVLLGILPSEINLVPDEGQKELTQRELDMVASLLLNENLDASWLSQVKQKKFFLI